MILIFFSNGSNIDSDLKKVKTVIREVVIFPDSKYFRNSLALERCGKDLS